MGAQWYLKNCPSSFGFFGALEVISVGAVRAYTLGQECCRAQLPYASWGEDRFMKQCLDLLGVGHLDDFNLISDRYCLNSAAGTCASEQVAFHPLKTREAYLQCWEETLNRDTYRDYAG